MIRQTKQTTTATIGSNTATLAKRKVKTWNQPKGAYVIRLLVNGKPAESKDKWGDLQSDDIFVADYADAVAKLEELHTFWYEEERTKQHDDSMGPHYVGPIGCALSGPLAYSVCESYIGGYVNEGCPDDQVVIIPAHEVDAYNAQYRIDA